MSSRITVVCGHYGCGKTNLALNLAVEAASKGRRSVIVDMDIVNPYFRSSEYGPFLERHGVQLKNKKDGITLFMQMTGLKLA